MAQTESLGQGTGIELHVIAIIWYTLYNTVIEIKMAMVIMIIIKIIVALIIIRRRGTRR